MEKNELVDLEIEDNVSLTKSIACIDGKKVLISGGWKGQEATVRIRKIRNNRIEADFVEAKKRHFLKQMVSVLILENVEDVTPVA